MTPAFDSAKTEYSLIVPSDTASVKISGEPVAASASVSGTGTVKLDYGTNTVTVNCTAQNGTTRAYTLTVVRQQPDGGAGTDPGTGTDGSAGTQISRGDVNGDGTIALADLVAVKRHILGFETLSGDKFKAADADGNGEITLADYVKIKRHILGYELLN